MTTITPAVPAFPLSIFDPVHLAIDENGEQVYVYLAERNMLLGGEPGGGKSNALNLITAHGALSRLQQIMNDRYDKLLAAGLRKITPATGEPVYLVVIDEYAYFSATVGDRKQQAEFAALTRDLVARGRAAGVIVILATQRPSHQVIDPSLRDLFGYRWAFRCTTDSSSDTVLGHGWAAEGYSAATIDPLARGVSWLLSETGTPRRIKAAYLTDQQIADLAALAAQLRRKEAA